MEVLKTMLLFFYILLKCQDVQIKKSNGKAVLKLIGKGADGKFIFKDSGKPEEFRLKPVENGKGKMIQSLKNPEMCLTAVESPEEEKEEKETPKEKETEKEEEEGDENSGKKTKDQKKPAKDKPEKTNLSPNNNFSAYSKEKLDESRPPLKIVYDSCNTDEPNKNQIFNVKKKKDDIYEIIYDGMCATSTEENQFVFEKCKSTNEANQTFEVKELGEEKDDENPKKQDEENKGKENIKDPETENKDKKGNKDQEGGKDSGKKTLDEGQKKKKEGKGDEKEKTNETKPEASTGESKTSKLKSFDPISPVLKISA